MSDHRRNAVRRARREDQPHLVELLGQLFAGAPDTRAADADWRSALPELLESDRMRVLVVEDEQGVVGMISFSFNQALRYAGEYCQIEELIVDPRGRGRNLGVLLVKSAIEAARDRGCFEIGLYAREETRAFYEKLGFGYRGPEVRLALR
jgi:ribosomal protein S18 acetylase RimI-like enzyme